MKSKSVEATPRTTGPAGAFPLADGSAVRCPKCTAVFNYPDGKRYSDGDIEQWCPSCGSGDDCWEEGEIVGGVFQLNKKAQPRAGE